MGFLAALFLLLLGLRLGHVIDWSWWLVCLPLALSTGIALGVALLED